MSDELRRIDAVVVLRSDLDDVLRRFHAAMGAELADMEVGALPLQVDLTVDGEEVAASLDLVVADGNGAYMQAVLQRFDSSGSGAHYYVVSQDETEDWRPGQYRLETDRAAFPLTVDTYKLIAS